MEYTREERAAIAQSFREEIKRYGIREAVINILQSSSDKVSVRRTVLEQQCRKPNFRKDFVAACEEIKMTLPAMRSAVSSLRLAIIGD